MLLVKNSKELINFVQITMNAFELLWKCSIDLIYFYTHLVNVRICIIHQFKFLLRHHVPCYGTSFEEIFIRGNSIGIFCD
jgi:hypothetical protein